MTSMTSERYQVEIVDDTYYKRIISCQNACPAHTDARGYINSVIHQDYKQGYVIAREPNPFASICGRACNAPCESACRRNNVDRPVTIRALKRFLCEHHGVEGKEHRGVSKASGRQWGAALLGEQILGNSRTMESVSTLRHSYEITDFKKKKSKVAIIGAGPAGLTAAHDLSAMGYSEVTVFEASPSPGGMLLLGIPEYRLPRGLIRSEIDDILSMGVNLKLNTKLGEDITLSALKEESFEAIFIALGAHKNNPMGLEGEDLDGVISGIDFLREINLGNPVKIGQRVAVIGGGNVALDAVRIALRIGETDNLAMDTIRTTAGLGAKDAFILYRRSREEMPASEDEIEDAEEEGIHIKYMISPTRIVGKNGKVHAIQCMRMELGEPDDSGRRRPMPIAGSEFSIDVDTVIPAIGQVSDLSFIGDADGIQTTKAGTIEVDHNTLATAAPGIFAGGDVAFGPRIIIDAVKDGHRAARSIDRYFHKGETNIVVRAALAEAADRELPADSELEIQKQKAPVVPVERRTGMSEVELSYDENTAREQASRCLNCNVQTVFDADLCILCGGCVDACPQSCYKMVSLKSIEGDQRVRDSIEARYGIELEEFQNEDGKSIQGTAMIKDETRCVRCSLCATRCPTGAITMKAFWFEEELVYENSARNAPKGGSVKQ